jgi:N-acetylneuraminic acid mutarotase
LSRNLDKNPFITKKSLIGRGLELPKTKLFSFVLTALLVTLSLSTLQVSLSENGATDDFWVSKTALPLHSGGIVGVNGKIYSIAGSGDYVNTIYVNNAVLEYDPALDAWTAKKPMPTERSRFATAVYQNKIYVIGEPDGMNQVYDPATDTWETKTPMPTPRTQLEANVVNGKIYLIGGRTGGQYSTVALNEVYDPETDLWTTKAPMPYPVVQYASAVVDDIIYIIGGQDEFSSPMNLDLVQIYDSESDIWSFGTPMPTVVWQAAAGATSGELAPKRIYVIGGLPDKTLYGTNINQVYNPENDSLTTGASMPTSRFQLHVAVVNDKLYAMGGSPYFNLEGIGSNENEEYMPIGYGTIPQQSPQPELHSDSFPITLVIAVVSVAYCSVVLVAYFVKLKNKKSIEDENSN